MDDKAVAAILINMGYNLENDYVNLDVIVRELAALLHRINPDMIEAK